MGGVGFVLYCFVLFLFMFFLSFLSRLSLSSTLSCESILDVLRRRDDGPLAAYQAFHQTTEGSKHVYTDSCAPLLNSILCGISGDWHVLCPSERVHLLKRATAGPSFFPLFPIWKRWTEMRHRETEWEEGQREPGSHSFLTVAWSKANVGTCVMS